MKRPGGVDQYPAVTVEWKLHHHPELFGYDDAGKQIGQPVNLAKYANDFEGLHALFSAHFARDKSVAPPSMVVRTWRRLFGWAYGISDMEAALLFVCAGAVLLLVGYILCFRYTVCCDTLQDI